MALANMGISLLETKHREKHVNHVNLVNLTPNSREAPQDALTPQSGRGYRTHPQRPLTGHTDPFLTHVHPARSHHHDELPDSPIRLTQPQISDTPAPHVNLWITSENAIRQPANLVNQNSKKEDPKGHL